MMTTGIDEHSSLWDSCRHEEHGEEALLGHSCGMHHVGHVEAH